MSMEIHGNNEQTRWNYVQQAGEKQSAGRTEEAQETNRVSNDTKGPGSAEKPHDAYISSERSGRKPSGLYRIGQDGDGRRKIFYDAPDKSPNGGGKPQSKVNGDIPQKDGDGSQPDVNGENPGKPVEKCVTDTDRVDREIKKLQEKQKQLEQQIRSAQGDEQKVQELEKKLAQVSNELSRKDNDTYRRQNASVSE